MLIIISISIGMLFGVYVFLEVSAVHARIAASLSKKNAIGATLEKMTHTIKRFAVFSYPPLLGALHVLSAPTYIFYAIYASLISAAIVVFLSVILRVKMIKLFIVLIEFLSRDPGKDGSAVARILKLSLNKYHFLHLDRSILSFFSKIDKKIIKFSALVYAVYGGSIFFVNIFVLFITGYDAIIFQMIGLINGIGTIVMAFLLDPMIARKLEAGQRMNVLSNSVFMGIFIAYCVILPSLFAGLHFLYISLTR